MQFGSQHYSVLLSVILLLLLSTCTPISRGSRNINKAENNNIKEAVFLSPKFELTPGSVVNKILYDIEFPRGHVALKSFNGEVVDEEGNSVPFFETYLHHWLVKRYHQRKSVTHTDHDDDDSDFILVRNSGTCQDDTLYQYFGLGSETRGTATDIPDPFGIEIGNPKEIPQGYEEKWMLNVHAIDTRGVEDKFGCIECRCDLYNVTVTKDQYGQPLKSEYHGGLLCCYDKTQCRLKEGYEGPKRNLFLRYTVKWVDWDNLIVPVKVYILDVTDRMPILKDSTETSTEHNCEIEYDVESCSNNEHKDSNDCIDVKRTSLSMQRGGYVVYGFSHQHTGGIGGTLFGQDGRTICNSIPRYGNGKEAGNEEGFLIGMSTCYPKPGSVKISDGEILTLESNYSRSSSHMHTGVMGLFYLLVAEHLPEQHLRPYSRASMLSNMD